MSSKRNSEKDLPGDEALDEVNKHIKDAFDILKRETNKLRKERNAFDEVAKKLEHVHFSTMLKLNKLKKNQRQSQIIDGERLPSWSLSLLMKIISVIFTTAGDSPNFAQSL